MAQVTYQKCRCGDAVCKQYTLSTQGSVGFSLEDARLYAAASDLLEALQSAVASLEQFVKLNRIPENNKGLRDARAAIARATGDTPVMRTVTVDELEALATQTAKIASDIAPLHTSCYDGDDSLTAAYDTCLKASAKFQETIYHMQRSLASARSDAEADKADAKRKDV